MEASDTEIQAFFDRVFKLCDKSSKPGTPVVSVYVNRDKKFAFVEFRSMEEASACMHLDGIEFKGTQIKIRRPSDYDAMNFPQHGTVPMLDLSALGIVSTQVDDGPNKVFCGGIPHQLDEEDTKELLACWGPLKSFHFVRDRETGTAKGFCFYEYTHAEATDDAIEGLNGSSIAGKVLTVRKAQQQGGHTAHSEMAYNMMSSGMMGSAAGMVQGITNGMLSSSTAKPVMTNVLVMKEMVTDADLFNDEDYTDIMEDVKSELNNYGKVKCLLMPRPEPSARGRTRVPGQGLVFAQFETPQQAEAARQEIDGREFDTRFVEASFMDEAKFLARDLSNL